MAHELWIETHDIRLEKPTPRRVAALERELRALPVEVGRRALELVEIPLRVDPHPVYRSWPAAMEEAIAEHKAAAS